ncbi:HepT-like ribonuclease domain-containing protein [Mucilaginibacter gilvus]|uniref:DUF86 domain-containing protein n=1 Tax=Mucilaginibacter gilvus TaxID=2305909 RepID=A0A444MP08_9SPHI|nr:DUF86 domain-containing protein [Mucilaginibacter gilvus]RWY52351.1 DUF86 domain-containing protein [Mucilaginibacter gilvus]
MSRSDSVYIEDILESITIIDNYITEKTEFDFITDMMMQDAVIRRFEIIGEAATKISEAVKTANPNVQWRLMKAMRNKLIHEYFGVSASTIYTTVKSDLPILKDQLSKIKL